MSKIFQNLGYPVFNADIQAKNCLIEDKELIQKIKNTFGSDLKFMIILRDPVERAYSHYLHTKRDGIEKKSFLINSTLEQLIFLAFFIDVSIAFVDISIPVIKKFLYNFAILIDKQPVPLPTSNTFFFSINEKSFLTQSIINSVSGLGINVPGGVKNSLS